MSRLLNAGTDRMPTPENSAETMGKDREARGKGKPLATAIRVIGFLLVLASLVFVGQRLHQHLAEFWHRFSRANWPLMLGAVVVFTLSQLLLSSAWYLLLRSQGARGLKISQAHVLCGRAQIAKYLPGNVFQYLARHLAFRRLGISDGSMMLAAAYETLSFVVAAGLLAAFGLPLFAERSSVISPPLAVLASVIGVIGMVVLVRYGHPLLKLVGRAPPAGSALRVGQALAVIPLYALFLGLSGCLALLLFRNAGGDESLEIAVIPAYALAWLSGYVVPGASAGLGLREATLLVLLGDTPQALFVSIGMRIITTFGDLLWFAVSTLVAQLQPAKA